MYLLKYYNHNKYIILYYIYIIIWVVPKKLYGI